MCKIDASMPISRWLASQLEMNFIDFSLGCWFVVILLLFLNTFAEFSRVSFHDTYVERHICIFIIFIIDNWLRAFTFRQYRHYPLADYFQVEGLLIWIRSANGFSRHYILLCLWRYTGISLISLHTQHNTAILSNDIIWYVLIYMEVILPL